MRRIKLLLFLGLIALSSWGNEFRIIESERFEVRMYDGVTTNKGERVLKALEVDYDRILEFLEIKKMPKVVVNIYKGPDFFEVVKQDLGIQYTGAYGYVNGEQQVVVRNSANSWVAVHEFIHIVSLEVNPRITNNPRWLWETVPIYLNNEFYHPFRSPGIRDKNYPTLRELNQFDFSPNGIYFLGYLIGEFIYNEWGSAGFIDLIKSNGDTQEVLGLSEEEFEKILYSYIDEKYMKR